VNDEDPCSRTFDPLLNALSNAAQYGTPYQGQSSSPADAVHSATVAVLTMVKFGSTGICATVGQGNCAAPWNWLVTARHHHAARCDALACAQCLWNCEACHSVEAATPDLHGCEHHGADRAFSALFAEWLCQEWEFVANVADELGASGVWNDSDKTTIPMPYRFERLFGHDTHRTASND
jgi:hypothetical protein